MMCILSKQERDALAPCIPKQTGYNLLEHSDSHFMLGYAPSILDSTVCKVFPIKALFAGIKQTIYDEAHVARLSKDKVIYRMHHENIGNYDPLAKYIEDYNIVDLFILLGLSLKPFYTRRYVKLPEYLATVRYGISRIHNSIVRYMEESSIPQCAWEFNQDVVQCIKCHGKVLFTTVLKTQRFLFEIKEYPNGHPLRRAIFEITPHFAVSDLAKT